MSNYIPLIIVAVVALVAGVVCWVEKNLREAGTPGNKPPPTAAPPRPAPARVEVTHRFEPLKPTLIPGKRVDPEDGEPHVSYEVTDK